MFYFLNRFYGVYSRKLHFSFLIFIVWCLTMVNKLFPCFSHKPIETSILLIYIEVFWSLLKFFRETMKLLLLRKISRLYSLLCGLLFWLWSFSRNYFRKVSFHSHHFLTSFFPRALPLKYTITLNFLLQFPFFFNSFLLLYSFISRLLSHLL